MKSIVHIATAATALLLTVQARLVDALPLSADPAGQLVSLPAPASPHWVWVNDFVFSAHDR